MTKSRLDKIVVGYYGETIFDMEQTDRMVVKDKLFQIAAETAQYDFPLLSSIEKRKIIIQRTKQEIDARMLGTVTMHHMDRPLLFLSDDLWEETKEEVKGKFDNLNDKQMMNGFYFQELMYVYVSNNIRLFDESWYSEINNSRNMD